MEYQDTTTMSARDKKEKGGVYWDSVMQRKVEKDYVIRTAPGEEYLSGFSKAVGDQGKRVDIGTKIKIDGMTLTEFAQLLYMP